MAATANSERMLLTDAAVKRQPFSDAKPRIIRDTKIPASICRIDDGAKPSATNTNPGARRSARSHAHRVAGRASPPQGRPTPEHWLLDHPGAPRAGRADPRACGRDPPPARTDLPRGLGEQYRAALIKEGKSPRTIADYEDKFETSPQGMAPQGAGLDHP